MGKLKQQAEQRGNELLKTSDVKLDRQAGTYQLINKATGKAENLPLSGIDVGSGLFAKNRRVNRLIGKKLTRNTELNTVGQIPAENTTVNPQVKSEVKQPVAQVTASTNIPTPSLGVKFGEFPTENRFDFPSMRTSTLVPRRSTFGNGMHQQFGSGTYTPSVETSTTGPEAVAPPAPIEVNSYQDWLSNKRSTIDDDMFNSTENRSTTLLPKPAPANKKVTDYVASRFNSLPDYIKRTYANVEAYGKDPMFKNLTENSKEVKDYEQGVVEGQNRITQGFKDRADAAEREKKEKERLKAYFAGGNR